MKINFQTNLIILKKILDLKYTNLELFKLQQHKAVN